MERKQNKQNCTEAGIKVSADVTLAYAISDDSTNATYSGKNITKGNTLEVQHDVAVQGHHEFRNGMGVSLGVNDLAENQAGNAGANLNLVVTAPGMRNAKFYISSDGEADVISKLGLNQMAQKTEEIKHTTFSKNQYELQQIGATATQGADDFAQTKNSNPTIGLIWNTSLGGQKTRFGISHSNSEGAASAGAQATTLAVAREFKDNLNLGLSYTEGNGLGLGSSTTVYGDMRLNNGLEFGGSFSSVEGKASTGLANHEVAVVSARMPVGSDDNKTNLAVRYMLAEGTKSGAKNADEILDLQASREYAGKDHPGKAKGLVHYQLYEAKNANGVKLSDGKRETLYVSGKYDNKLGFGNCPPPKKE